MTFDVAAWLVSILTLSNLSRSRANIKDMGQSSQELSKCWHGRPSRCENTEKPKYKQKSRI